MIKVCDVIMGAGKSSTSINYMNEHPNEKFIYITPYLEESERIKENCKALNFVMPSNKIKEYNFKKSIHTMALIKDGRNISTTHQAFKGYTPETLDEIKRQGYTLIIDENVDILEKFEYSPSDLQLLINSGFVNENNGIYTYGSDGYDGTALRDIMRLLKSREIVRMSDTSKYLYFWTLPPSLLTSFKDVYIMTYLFEGQSLKYFMDIYGLEYSYIGIERTSNGEYRFCDYPGYIPEYVYHLKDKLHILDNDKLNEIGEGYFDLSKSWFEKNPSKVSQLKNNVGNCFKNIWIDKSSDKRMWGTFKESEVKIKGKGYAKGFVTFNMKATNQYKNKDCLVYIANCFMNKNEKMFYEKHGIVVNEDMYALSIMVQWIWRSAIREGNEVNLYIPSRRMRNLLIDWMDSLAKGGEPAA